MAIRMHGTAFHGDGRHELRGQGNVFELSPEEEARLLRDYPERFEAVIEETRSEPPGEPPRTKRLRHAEDK